MQTNIAYTVLQQKTFITLCKSSKKPTNPRAPIHPPSSSAACSENAGTLMDNDDRWLGVQERLGKYLNLY